MARYFCKPYEVEALKILSYSHIKTDGSIEVALEDGTSTNLSESKIHRYMPGVNDYVVRITLPHAYEFVMAKDIFEAQYEPAEDSTPAKSVNATADAESPQEDTAAVAKLAASKRK